MAEERGLFEKIGDGAIPGTFVGFSLAAARAYLESRTVADKSTADIAAAKSAKVPPTAAALRALRPNPLPGVFATTAIYGALGGTFTGTAAIAESIRGKEDMWNRVIGATTAGSLVGLRTASIRVSGLAAFSCGFMTMFVEAVGGTWGPVDDPSLERREAIYKA